ncbi:MAG: 30S ribosomal protein S4 [archaeon]
MGDPKSARKQYGTPKKPWDKKLLATEKELRETYGLRNKREIRRLDSLLRKKRANAKRVLALPVEQRAAKEKELVDSLVKTGIMRGKPALNEVLALSIESFLERRLETLVWRKHLANTPKQARQFITHGHIGINGKKITVPSYMVPKADEVGIAYFGKPMVLLNPEQQKKDTKQLENDFAEMRGEPTGTESPLRGEVEESPISPDAADAAREAKAQSEEGK